MTIQPALTEEQWAKFRVYDWVFALYDAQMRGEVRITCDDGYSIEIREPHALAALCLHGQPFGFTREEMEAVALVAENRTASSADDLNVAPLVRSAAAKIAALLPKAPRVTRR